MMDLTYNQMKTECARLGLSAIGTKQELAERLDRFERGEDAQKIFVGEEDNSTISPEEVKVENPTKDQSQNTIEGELEKRRVEHITEWEKIKRRLDIIFAGRVQYRLQENSPPCEKYPSGNYAVVFTGTARKGETVNLSAGIKTIEKIAMQYISPTDVKIDRAGDTMEEALKKAQARAG